MRTTTKKPLLFVGIDGGGTSAKYVIEDEQGKILAEDLIYGNANVATNVGATFATISAIFDKAQKDLPSINFLRHKVYIGAALAGISNEKNANILTTKLQVFSRHTTLMTDLDAAHEANFKDQDNTALIIAGTGSILSTNIDGDMSFLGGHGFACGSDGGSGADIGRRSIQTTIACEDGREEHTKLTKYISKNYPELVADIRKNPAHKAFAKASDIVKCHINTDSLAQRIWDDNDDPRLVGQEAVHQALRADNGEIDHTSLTKELCKNYGGRSGLLQEFNKSGQFMPRDFGEIAPIVDKYARIQMDSKAIEILSASAAEVSKMIKVLNDKGVKNIKMVGGSAEAIHRMLGADKERVDLVNDGTNNAAQATISIVRRSLNL